jgi:hypothetical protein
MCRADDEERYCRNIQEANLRHPPCVQNMYVKSENNSICSW